MGKQLFHIVLLLLSFNCWTQDSPNSFKVMAWDIHHGANDVENGRENAIAIIKEVNPDVILMAATYGSGKLTADALGYLFHIVAQVEAVLDDKGTNLAIISNRETDRYRLSFLSGRMRNRITHQKKV